MKIILKEKTENLGSLGDIVTVKPGYARNYLIPCGKGIQATKENILTFKKRKVELEKVEIMRLEKARENAQKIEGQNFIIKAAAGDNGKLFGSVKSKDIAKIIAAQKNIIVEKRDIRMPEKAIRTIGEFTLAIHLDIGINANIKLHVEAE